MIEHRPDSSNAWRSQKHWSVGRIQSPSPEVGARVCPAPHHGSLYDVVAEEKCRNILVRYCAHVPRNYQYRDGIQVVFLILRDHFGDQGLGIAGGVLYELIEIDCTHSDDAGAAFQRWRHDHMNRHADLELPHIPHLTTVTSAIKPSSNLVKWREAHTVRYPIKLSDYAPSSRRGSEEPSCIKNRKPWTIEHTMYVSNRDSGTSIFRKASPGECHRLQWNMGASHVGQFLQEKEFIPPSLNFRGDEVGNPSDGINRRHVASISRTRISSIILDQLRGTYGHREFRRRSPVSVGSVDKGQAEYCSSSIEMPSQLISSDMRLASLPEGHIIPHPIFARKFALIESNEPIPRSMASNLMPTADSMATSIEPRMTAQGVLDSGWVFRGPFTPQLWFDGGRDFEWDPAGPCCTDPKLGPHHATSGLRRRLARADAGASNHRKRPGRAAHDWFGLDGELPSLPEPNSSSPGTRRPPYCKPPVHGYNWFFLD